MKMKHYYDPGLDDCPIHEDSDVEYLYEVNITFPIGYEFDFPSWKAADHASKKLINSFEEFMNKNNYNKDDVIIEANLKHVGKKDSKMCGKLIHKYPDKKEYKKLIKKWLF